jgi:hypothetical protein
MYGVVVVAVVDAVRMSAKRHGNDGVHGEGRNAVALGVATKLLVAMRS